MGFISKSEYQNQGQISICVRAESASANEVYNVLAVLVFATLGSPAIREMCKVTVDY